MTDWVAYVIQGLMGVVCILLWDKINTLKDQIKDQHEDVAKIKEERERRNEVINQRFADQNQNIERGLNSILLKLAKLDGKSVN